MRAVNDSAASGSDAIAAPNTPTRKSSAANPPPKDTPYVYAPFPNIVANAYYHIRRTRLARALDHVELDGDNEESASASEDDLPILQATSDRSGSDGEGNEGVEDVDAASDAGDQ